MSFDVRPRNQSFDAAGLQYVWDSTSLKLADECMQKYYYKMIEGWDNPRKSHHLRFGIHYATALEHFHKHLADGMPRNEAVAAVVYEALCDTWDRPVCEICKGDGTTDEEQGGTTTCLECGGKGVLGQPWTSGDPNKNRENLIRSIIWYLDHFEEDPVSTVILADGKPAVEHSFTLPVDNGIYFAGHLDRLGEYSSKNYVTDNKTTGATLSSYYFNQFSPDMQMSMYTFAGKAIFGIPVSGVIIDAAQIAVGFTRFERGFTFRTEAQLNEWYDDTMYLIETARRLTAENHFPKKLTSCGNYGGCEFRAVCARSPEVRKNFLEADFKQGWVWDPLQRR